MARAHQLIVMRHAKAGDLPDGPDFDRPLRPRGLRDSAAAGRWLAACGYEPDVVACSAARRTQQTWQHLAPELSGEPEFYAEQSLYHASAADVLELVRRTPESAGRLLYVGHNPAAAELAAMLSGAEPEFPTAAIAVIELPGDWAALAPGGGDLIASWTPRG